MSLKKIQLPGGDIQEINSFKTESIPFGIVDATSTATAFTATVPGITRLEDGTCVLLKNGVITSASGFTVDINGLGAKPVYSNMAATTRETTIFNINYTLLLIYDSTRVSGGCWVNYRGYYSDANSIGYQLRTNSSSLPMTSVTYRYRLLFTSADGAHFVPANNSTSTDATSSKTVCQDKIDPFGRIVYYGTTASVAAGSRPAAANLWIQYAIALGYSFNRTGAELTLTSWKPVYVKCAPQTDGSAIIDSTTPYVQDLPTADDGKIYILLGVAYNATNIELFVNHPVYYFKEGVVRPWVNVPASQSITVDQTYSSTSSNAQSGTAVAGAISTKQDTINDLTDIRNGASAGATAYQKPSTGIPATDLASTVQTSLGLADTALQSYTETDPTVPSWAKASSKPSYTFSEIGSTPSTLQGYGITDAKIQNGVITLGSNTITPVTSETDPTVPSWAKQSTKPTYNYSEIQNTPTIPTVPDLSTSVESDKASNAKTSTPKSVYDFVKPATQSSQPAGGMVPGVLYKLGTLTGNVTISLASVTDATVSNEYMFTFTADSTAPTITWPASVTMWAGNCVDNGAPVITGGNSYEVSILDGKGIIVEWEA